LQGEDVALFSIDGNHFGYENELELPNRINFDGAKVKLGPFSFGLGWADKPFRRLVNVVNKAIVPGFEWLQYRAYFLSPILVRAMLLSCVPQRWLQAVGFGHCMRCMKTRISA
jgi:hypothetical protein